MRAALWVFCLGFSLAAGSGCDDEVVDGDGDVDAGIDTDVATDADADADIDGQPCPAPCGDTCCEVGQACVRDLCIAEVSCAGGDPCQDDRFCEAGLCVPFGPPFSDFDEDCEREIPPSDSFEPEIQCEWPPPDETDLEFPNCIGVITTGLVGDLDGDDVSEIVFVSFETSVYTSGILVTRAIRGDDCSTVWSVTDRPIVDLALADLDEDGTIEVCGHSTDGTTSCLDHEGNVLWTGHDEAGRDVGVEPGVASVGVAIAEVDGEAPPEIITGLSTFDSLTGLLEHLGPSVGAGYQGAGIVPAIADVDGDGHLDAASGGLLVDLVDGSVANWGTPSGFVAVAELDETSAGPEIVAVQSPYLRVHASTTGEVLWYTTIPGSGGGAPTVADLDGDGRAEIAVVGHNTLTAFDLDCLEDPPDPTRCANPGAHNGIIWSVPVQEISSGVTGSSVFDFEGDGSVEVVYADECWARVFDGTTGTVKFSVPHESVTSTEYPTIADVDGDLATEMVVPHNTIGAYPVMTCPIVDPLFPSVAREPGRPYNGITIYRDREDRWAPSRPLWSQHTEHHSQRNDDGTVPAVELPSWETHNSYRQALLSEYPDSARWVPDLTVGGLEATEACLVVEGEDLGHQQLAARVCNRGTLAVAAGVEVSFHLGSPEGEVLCTATTSEDLEPGVCAEVSCLWDAVPVDTEYEVVAVVDSGDERQECREDNNGASRRDICPRPPDWPY